MVDRVDISNWRRLGVPEYILVEDMIKCANKLAEMEDQATAGKDKKQSNKTQNNCRVTYFTSYSTDNYYPN